MSEELLFSVLSWALQIVSLILVDKQGQRHIEEMGPAPGSYGFVQDTRCSQEPRISSWDKDHVEPMSRASLWAVFVK